MIMIFSLDPGIFGVFTFIIFTRINSKLYGMHFISDNLSNSCYFQTILPRILKQKIWRDPRLQAKFSWNCNESQFFFSNCNLARYIQIQRSSCCKTHKKLIKCPAELNPLKVHNILICQRSFAQLAGEQLFKQN